MLIAPPSETPRSAACSRAGRIHDGAHIVHALLERRRRRHPVRHPGAALVELISARPRRELAGKNAAMRRDCQASSTCETNGGMCTRSTARRRAPDRRSRRRRYGRSGSPADPAGILGAYPPRVKVCPSCGHENPEDARFCSRARTSLDAGGAAHARSARSSPCSSADLVGFTARAEQLDPEDVRALARALPRARARRARALRRHGREVHRRRRDGRLRRARSRTRTTPSARSAPRSRSARRSRS